jgi:hypothetical protein
MVSNFKENVNFQLIISTRYSFVFFSSDQLLKTIHYLLVSHYVPKHIISNISNFVKEVKSFSVMFIETFCPWVSIFKLFSFLYNLPVYIFTDIWRIRFSKDVFSFLNSRLPCLLGRSAFTLAQTTSLFCSSYFGQRVSLFAQVDLDWNLPISSFLK